MSASKWNCSLCTFENNVSSPVCQICQTGQSPHTSRQKGVVGLTNLGIRNTSFINAIIQCLIQSPYFTEYFLNNEYIHHINMSNPVGYNGSVAKVFASLLQDLWSGKYKSIEPKQFKSTIDTVASRFDQNEQHDAFDFLSFLLNGLHQDLNKISNEPLTQPNATQNNCDDITANKSWLNHLKRNKSIITHLFTSQQKSIMTCQNCNSISNKFIPYSILSLPIPSQKYKVVEYTFIDCSDTSIVPTVYRQKILKVADIDMLKTKIVHSINTRYKQNQMEDKIVVWGYIRQFEYQLHSNQVIPNGVIQILCDYYVFIHVEIITYHVFVCDIWKSKIHRELRRTDCVADISRKSDDIFVYYVPGYIKNKKSTQTFVVNNQHRVQVRDTGNKYEDQPIGFPLLMTFRMTEPITMSQIRNALWILIKPLLRNENLNIDGDDVPFQFWAAWGFNNHAKIINVKEIFDLKARNLKFLVHWTDPNQYKSELYDMNNRARDASVQLSLEINDEDKSVDLKQSINIFNVEETLSGDDATYCSICKDFTVKQNRMLWNAPDLLIIHLKRFMNTKNLQRINTLVTFPLKGLDLSPYLLCNDAKQDTIYDLYAVTNHDDSNDCVYSAYTKNLHNPQWYGYENDHVSEVINTDTIISSEAYILYYCKRNRTI